MEMEPSSNIGIICKHHGGEAAGIEKIGSHFFHVASKQPDLSSIVGKHVKVRIADTEKGQVERLWVRVKKVKNGKIKGVIDNDPVVVNMRCGEPVEIEPKHVFETLG